MCLGIIQTNGRKSQQFSLEDLVSLWCWIGIKRWNMGNTYRMCLLCLLGKFSFSLECVLLHSIVVHWHEHFQKMGQMQVVELREHAKCLTAQCLHLWLYQSCQLPLQQLVVFSDLWADRSEIKKCFLSKTAIAKHYSRRVAQAVVLALITFIK